MNIFTWVLLKFLFTVRFLELVDFSTNAKFPNSVCVCAVTQLCLALCNPIDCRSQAPLWMGILQAGILEWVAMPFSRGSSQPRDGTQVSCIAG